ncbi:alpha/beta fold hydrolase [Streptomyces sp. NBC_00247]|uniref:thioesterase II family protein n=1 Tax=Streptomyces sp. NBC_00247 TaxID=2975689 RepID=UPI002E2ACB0F|nr:alpha/beta fold hydrolase [Streptomyces sp. NBC_00247]
MGAVGGAGAGGTAAKEAGTRWLRNWQPRPGAAVNLVCLPHAGGSAGFYRGWPGLLPAGIDFHAVQYPGREDRFAETPLSRMAELADGITDAVRPLFDKDVILFGHSMGANVAWEVAGRCEAEGLMPRLLLLSGRSAPQPRPDGARRPRSDDEIIDEIRGFSTAGSTALDDPDLRELLLPMIRADYRLVEEYRLESAAPVRAPIAVLRGRDDTEVTAEGAFAWRELTAGACTDHVFDGGHFYLREHEGPVLGAVAALVARALR